MSGSGDLGETYLPRMGRVRKSHPRVEAFGEVDELSSFIGYARSIVKDKDLDMVLKTVQDSLFHVGAYLATPSHSVEKIRRNNELIEEWVKRYSSSLPSLRRFIYPAGCVEASVLHICRSVARRAERAVVRVGDEEQLDEAVTRFLNRLSTLLFLMARELNRRANLPDEEWSSV
ncbi:MAG: cob(I)yrinic acid a,c-diamide adenosyltransferase [Candidatus Caldarchaeum sp.]|nr:cob(I)yrinic acid a,c-diamide adenosyltransferase [Candidatus Caldarchaeum sp.]MDW7977532.1 cob(I)yrinic acid a,c-diamide adenosyltransferase [Candidatus Caldarchaeum sp.]MDW8360170.1 cob(I)yrinic acid a,c-diamide adenosyltransferase [Candidatus Caldarchaeum sp.]